MNKKITSIRSDIDEIEKLIIKSESEKKLALDKIQKLNDIISAVKKKEVECNIFIEKIGEQLYGMDIDLGNLISIKIDLTEINKILGSEEKSLESIRLLLGETETSNLIEKNHLHQSLHDKLENRKDSLKLEKGKLDSEQQIFQEYLTAKDNWNKDRQALIGTRETPNTIAFFEAELAYLKEELPGFLENKYEERKNITQRILIKNKR